MRLQIFPIGRLAAASFGILQEYISLEVDGGKYGCGPVAAQSAQQHMIIFYKFS